MSSGGTGRAIGRPPVTTRAELEHVALALFLEDGFEETTVDDIARAAGISRRTFFRYFASKNDVAWGDFDEHLARFQAHFDAVPATVPTTAALFECVLAFNDFSDAELPWLRQRMRLLLGVPALQAHSALRYRAWCDIVAGFVARRTARRDGALLPQVMARSALGTAIAAYEHWLEDDGAALRDVLAEALSIWLGTAEGRGSDRRATDGADRVCTDRVEPDRDVPEQG
ncbi:MAG: mycofactocin system transcriptional regulator [Acidimicrobiales bacterium]